MATYYGTYGQKVQYLASDPSDPQIGQVWYNSTSAVLKVRQAVVSNAFASGGNMGTARFTLGGCGTKTAALAFGGTANPPIYTNTEKYNGTSWSPTGSMGTGREQISGTGTQTAALAYGGATGPGAVSTTASESFNGTSWSPSPALNTAKRIFGTAGIQTAALAFGGIDTATTAATESYNGTSWTTVNSLNAAVNQNAGAGTQTAGLSFGGEPGSGVTAATEEWNGAGSPQTKTITVS